MFQCAPPIFRITYKDKKKSHVFFNLPLIYLLFILSNTWHTRLSLFPFLGVISYSSSPLWEVFQSSLFYLNWRRFKEVRRRRGVVVEVKRESKHLPYTGRVAHSIFWNCWIFCGKFVKKLRKKLKLCKKVKIHVIRYNLLSFYF